MRVDTHAFRGLFSSAHRLLVNEVEDVWSEATVIKTNVKINVRVLDCCIEPEKKIIQAFGVK